MLDQDKFIADFQTQFLATWAANEYSKRVPGATVEYDWLKDAPITEAMMLARHIWHQVVMRFGPPVPWR